MRYKIICTYNTGDSFSNETGCKVSLQYTWSNFEIAKENLTRIKEHYDFYNAIHHRHIWNDNRDSEIIKDASEKDWYYVRDEYNLDSSFKLKDDDGMFFVVSGGDWCGYFETLTSVEVGIKQEIIYINRH